MRVLGHVDEVSRDTIVGWLADAENPGESLPIQIVVDGHVRAEIRAETFREGLLNALPGSTGRYEYRHHFAPALSAQVPHVVEVLIGQNGTLVPNGRRRIAASAEQKGQLTPVFVTSTGRSGTTLLMHEFSKRDAFVLADIYPFEIKLASYFAATLKVLAHPRSHTSDEALSFSELAFRDLRAIPNPWNQPALQRSIGGRALENFFADAVPRRLTSVFRDTVLDHYGIIAASQDRVDARYFAEKLTLNYDLRGAVRDLFGTVKEIVLVRDPRDYLCSAKSFWKTGLVEGLQTLRSEIPIINRIHQENASDVLFVRYEDLVLDPASSRLAINTFLDLPRDDDVPADPEILGKHATTSNPAASIGRWKTELASEEASACLTHFASFMRSFGYEL